MHHADFPGNRQWIRNGFQEYGHSGAHRVLNEKSQGWNTLIVNTRGGDMLMRYAGKSIP